MTRDPEPETTATSSRHQVGMRVFAVLSADAAEVQLLGFGTYVGDEVPPDGLRMFEYSTEEVIAQIRETDARGPDPYGFAAWYQEQAAKGEITQEEADRVCDQARKSEEADRARPIEERAEELREKLMGNPKIELDNGEVVWGYQCWWGPQERWPEIARGRKVREVQLPPLAS